jgi:hypothetical protein
LSLWNPNEETIAHSMKNDQSITSPDFIIYDEYVARTLYSLETTESRANADQSEANVMDEYRNVVHTVRRHLQLGFSSGTGPSLKADGSILMVHAHWKVFRELTR